MSDNNDFTFAAVITITFPAEEGSAQLDVMLAPTDHIETGDGAFKPLGDCTLAELWHFADSLEAEAWAEFKGLTLSELVRRNQADITFSIADELPESMDFETFSLLNATAPEEEAGVYGDDSKSDRISDSELEDAQQAELYEIGSVDAGERDGDAPGEPLAEDAVEDLETGSPPEIAEEFEADVSAEEPEPQVTVADSEPVHEDREAPPFEGEADEALAVVRPEIRILGKRRPLNHHTWTAVDILVNESAFRDAQAHALGNPHREVAGVLVGPQPEKQPDGRYVVHISNTIIARHTRMQGASVTYTPESWRYVNDRMAELFPDGTAVIVGWYHTHPGFGIFLSGMDQFIHQNFFTQIWHVAMVLDPLAGNSGFFCWNREKDKVAAYDFPWPEWASESW
jgi:proteasome lid subunit RPN8/RPN11